MDGVECNARPMQIQDGHCGEARRSWHGEGMHVELGQFTTVRVHSCLAYTQKRSLSIYLSLLASAVRQQKSRAAELLSQALLHPRRRPLHYVLTLRHQYVLASSTLRTPY